MTFLLDRLRRRWALPSPTSRGYGLPAKPRQHCLGRPRRDAVSQRAYPASPTSDATATAVAKGTVTCSLSPWKATKSASGRRVPTPKPQTATENTDWSGRWATSTEPTKMAQRPTRHGAVRRIVHCGRSGQAQSKGDTAQHGSQVRSGLGPRHFRRAGAEDAEQPPDPLGPLPGPGVGRLAERVVQVDRPGAVLLVDDRECLGVVPGRPDQTGGQNRVEHLGGELVMGRLGGFGTSAAEQTHERRRYRTSATPAEARFPGWYGYSASISEAPRSGSCSRSRGRSTTVPSGARPSAASCSNGCRRDLRAASRSAAVIRDGSSPRR
jgi:hypothetical protein